MIEKFRFNKITIILAILSSLSFTPSNIQASSHLRIELPKLKFEICLVYPVCSFYILDESRKNAMMSGFYHDKIVVRMEPLVSMSYIRQCTKEITHR